MPLLRMKGSLVGAAVAILVPAAVAAKNRVHIAPMEMVAAIKSADPVLLDGVDAAALTASSVRVIRCVGPDEEPTEFECVWQTRSQGRWNTHKSWLAMEGKGWRIIG
jgi:hypothetical protein